MIITVQGKVLPDELTEAEQAELEAAEKLQPVFDEECPPMTEEQLRQFVRMNRSLKIFESRNDIQR